MGGLAAAQTSRIYHRANFTDRLCVSSCCIHTWFVLPIDFRYVLIFFSCDRGPPGLRDSVADGYVRLSFLPYLSTAS